MCVYFIYSYEAKFVFQVLNNTQSVKWIWYLLFSAGLKKEQH